MKLLPGLVYVLLLTRVAFADERPSLPITSEGGGWESVLDGVWIVCSTGDKHGNFYFVPEIDFGRGIFKLHPDGKRVKIADYENAISIQWSAQGTLVLGDNSGRGRLIEARSTNGEGSKLESRERELAANVIAWRMAVAPDGRTYFSDIMRNRICVFDPAKKAVREIGEMREPTAIAISPDGRTLYAGNKLQNDIAMYSVAQDGSITLSPNKLSLERIWTPNDERFVRLGQRPPNSVNLQGLCTDSEGRVYAATLAGVQIFGANGEYVGIVRNPAKEPIHAITMADDFLYICAGRAIYRQKIAARSWAFGPK